MSTGTLWTKRQLPDRLAPYRHSNYCTLMTKLLPFGFLCWLSSALLTDWRPAERTCSLAFWTERRPNDRLVPC